MSDSYYNRLGLNKIELQTLKHTFQCENVDDFLSGYFKLEAICNLFEIPPEDPDAKLQIILHLACNLFEDFDISSSPLIYKNVKKTPGRPKSIQYPHDFDRIVDKIKEKEGGTDPVIISKLIDKNVIEGEKSSLIRELSFLRTKRKKALQEAKNDFS
jgi:hypothetical protein